MLWVYFSVFKVVVFKDIINCEKYPGLFIIMNNRTQSLYEKILTSISNILTQNSLLKISLEYIITDTEYALINAIKKIFPTIKRIGCYFHLKYDCKLFLQKNQFYKKENLIETKEVLSFISVLFL